MSVLPNTTKGTDWRWPSYVLMAVVLAALALGVEAFLRTETFSMGRRSPPRGPGRHRERRGQPLPATPTRAVSGVRWRPFLCT